MRKISSVVILVLCLLSCKNSSKQIVIKGDIEGLGNETILVYGANNKGDALDTIYANKGKFEYKAPVDTFTQVTFLFKNLEECPVYLDKGDKVDLTGNSSSLDLLKVEGGADINAEMNEFKDGIADLSNKVSDIKSQLYAAYLSGNRTQYEKLSKSPLLVKTQDEIKKKAEVFIRNHTTSPASIYLLNRYFIQASEPNITKIKDLTNVMSGRLKDDPFIQNLVRSMSILSSVEVGKLAPSFSLSNNGNKIISLIDYKNKYVLLHFWATWSEPSLKENTLLRTIKKQFSASNLSILGISLDVDKLAWKGALKKDSLVGEQVCDFNGWNSYAAIQYGVESLPYNVLIDPQGKIVALGLKGAELTKKIEEVFKKDLSIK